MLFGVIMLRDAAILSGVIGMALILFQVFEGKRKIRFKGRLHMRVHRWSAYALVAVSVTHLLIALRYLGVI